MRRIAVRLCTVFCSVGLLTASLPAASEPLTVAVAANMQYAFDDLAAGFRQETGIEAKGVYASSGKLSAQIRNGAPYAVFLSADMSYPEALYRDGVAVTAPKVYARGVLVLWTMNAIDLGKGMQVLGDPAVRKVAIANPRVAPYGQEALNALDHFGLRTVVEPRLVYGESIAQVNQYIDSRAADIGFTAKSVVLAPAMAGRGTWVELPGGSYQPIAQGVVILRYGTVTNAAASRRFMDYLSSTAARAILEKYGYQLP